MATWRDLWIDRLGEIDSGEVAITGRMEDGLVVPISSVDFDQHCLDDVYARAWLELLVGTVVE